MNFKKILITSSSIVLASLPVLNIVACGNDTNEKGTIIISVPSNSNNYNKAIANFAKIEAEKRGYNTQEIVTGEDLQLERSKILQAISRGGVKGVVIAPSQSRGSAPLIKELNNKKIPVITFDRTIDKATGAKLLGSIVTDNAGSAKQLVKWIKDKEDLAQNIQNIYIVNGESGGSSAIERAEGFDEGSKDLFSNITLNSKFVVNTDKWSATNARTKFTQLASDFYATIDNGKKGLILSAAIPMTNGIVTSNAFNLAKSYLVGFDIDKSNTENLKNDKILAAGMQRPDIMAAWSLAMLNIKIKNITIMEEENKYYQNSYFQEVAPLNQNYIDLPITIITKTNINQIVY